MGNILSLTNVINVTVLGAASNLSLPNINTCALFSTETPSWSETDDYKIYVNASDVGTDFGTNSIAFAMATAFFAQQPNVLTTGGYLVIILREAGDPIETTQAAIVRTLNLVYYFGILVDTSMDSDEAGFATLAAYVQTLDKMFFYASNDPANYAPGGMFDLVRQASQTNTRCLYYNDGTAQDTILMAAAYAARGLSTDFSGTNTTTTLHLKSLANVIPDTTIDQTDLIEAGQAGVDVYISVAGVSSIFTSGENTFFDQIYNQFWFKFALQVAGFNYLRDTSTKIPQTQSGLEGLKNEYRKVCAQAVNNGFVAPGAWNSSTVFGNPKLLIENIENIGYYVYSLPINSQSQSDRESRTAPLIQIAIKSAGAIQKSNVIVYVNL